MKIYQHRSAEHFEVDAELVEVHSHDYNGTKNSVSRIFSLSWRAPHVSARQAIRQLKPKLKTDKMFIIQRNYHN